MKTVLLLSGGLDSAVCGALCRNRGDEIHALTFDYGQRHVTEIEFARSLATWIGAARHDIVDLRAFGGLSRSALTSSPESIPKGTLSVGIAPTFVPARNLLFLSYAIGVAGSNGADSVCTGVNAVDYSGYPDCRPEFVDAFRGAAREAMPRLVRVETPLIHMSKRQIAVLSRDLRVPETLSCYDPIDGSSCGQCDSCLIRKDAFDVPN